MKKLQDKIMSADFGKKLKQIILLAVCVALLGGGVSTALLWPQINEAVTAAQELRTEKAQGEQPYDQEIKDGVQQFGEHDKEYYKDHYEEDFLRTSISRPSTAAFISVGVTGLLLWLLGLAFWLAVTAWLYQMAVLSGMNGPLWALLGLGGNLFAAALFLIVRSFIREKCPACGRWQEKNGTFCRHCGKKLRKSCANCGATDSGSGTYCAACGGELK